MFRKSKGDGGFGKTGGDLHKIRALNLGNGEQVPANNDHDSHDTAREQSQLYCCPDENLIYAAPTVDTLGDEESLSRLYHSPRGIHDQASWTHASSNIASIEEEEEDSSIPPTRLP